jgi:iron complex outermembrane receptor protein
MANWTSDYSEKPEIFPGIDAAYQVTPAIKLTGSFNRSLHLPTFTDLFYKDPSNQGNINLNPNRMVSYELGAKYDRKAFYSSVSLFLNNGKDIIDWLWFPANQKFSPVNLKHFQSRGVEFLVYYNFKQQPAANAFLENLQINYTYINVNKTATEEVSKYYNLKQKLDILLQHKIWHNLHASWNISYEERTGDYITYNAISDTQDPVPFRPFWLVDTRVFWQQKYYSLFVEASNLLNTKYVDVASLTQPGRWIKAGIKLNIDFK